MKKLLLSLLTLLVSSPMMAQGWPSEYKGVMLQAFYWDSYNKASKWTNLQAQVDELSQYFQLVWIPQSGNCNGKSMGYDPYYLFPGTDHYTSSFGSEKQLRSMISTFKEKKIETIADVVINHRKSGSGWFGFPTETYNNITYTMTSTDVCSDDDNGKAQTEATRLKVALGAADTGEGWDGMRDLDHKSENVQNIVKAYLHALLEDLGYAGFRYDMVKGYSGTFTGLYNKDSSPKYSVGEYWDGNASNVKSWINSTKVDNVIQSAAFDFPFRYTVRDACNNGNWAKLANSSLASDGNYRRYGVTFIENHDTEFRSANAPQDPIKKDTLAGNAHMLAMPGTPCVFLKHWIDCKEFIKSMIEARRLAGISNTSSITRLKNSTACYAFSTDDRLIAVLGNVSNYAPTDNGWVKILDGYHYAYYIRNTVGNTAWISHASGKYQGEQKVILAAITTQNARIVYTTDGSTPTASSPSVASGEKITIPIGTTTLKAAMLVNGNITGDIITREYEVEYVEPFSIPSFCTVADGEVCAFFEAPITWTNTIKCWAWNANNSNANYTGGTWPGVECTKLGTNNGKDVWKWTFKATDYKGSGNATQPTLIIFSSNGDPQTDNLTFKNGGYYNQDGLRDIVTGIGNVVNKQQNRLQRYYTIDGRYAGNDKSTLPHGIFITNGKKFVR